MLVELIRLVTMLIPLCCVVCGRDGFLLCEECHLRLVPAPPLCPPQGTDGARALFVYDEVGSRVIGALKYANAHRLVGLLGPELAEVAPACAEVVTWAPATPQNRRRRGYDQGELLAREVGRRLGVPCRRLLWRGRDVPQTARGRTGRAAGPRLRCRGPVPGRVLVVDDVLTTGATLGGAARLLRRHGAGTVEAMAVAWTPPPAAED